MKKTNAKSESKSKKPDKKKTKKWSRKSEQVTTARMKLTSIKPKKTGFGLTSSSSKQEAAPGTSLRERMLQRLDAARFRLVNEELDSMGSEDSNPRSAFDSNLEQFKKYHDSYKDRVKNWPSDPLNVIIKFIKKKIPQDKVIADFGCGEARLSESVPHKVHSFDLFALNDRVTACDMSATPLKDQSVDVAVFCLSLMGTEVSKYIAEASRVLKMKGILKIAEVSSRFPDNYQTTFVKRLKKFGFVPRDKQILRDTALKGPPRTEVFLMFEFLKIRAVKQFKGKLASVKLSPCLYKKR